MNKETRTFIWGVLVLLICCSGVAINIFKLREEMVYTWFDWTSLLFYTLGCLSGGISVFKTID